MSDEADPMTLPFDEYMVWLKRPIEQRLTIPAASSAPLARGARAAWRLSEYAGLMDGISNVHRIYDEESTYCDEGIPERKVHFPVLRSLSPCSLCESRHASGWTRPVPESEETLTTSDSVLARSVA